MHNTKKLYFLNKIYIDNLIELKCSEQGIVEKYDNFKLVNIYVFNLSIHIVSRASQRYL